MEKEASCKDFASSRENLTWVLERRASVFTWNKQFTQSAQGNRVRAGRKGERRRGCAGLSCNGTSPLTHVTEGGRASRACPSSDRGSPVWSPQRGPFSWISCLPGAARGLQLVNPHTRSQPPGRGPGHSPNYWKSRGVPAWLSCEGWLAPPRCPPAPCCGLPGGSSAKGSLAPARPAPRGRSNPSSAYGLSRGTGSSHAASGKEREGRVSS